MIHLYALGDKSRYQFLRNLGISYSTEEASTKPIILYNSVSATKPNEDAIFCPSIPPNTSIEFPCETDCPSVTVWDTVLFFDEFPFRTDYKTEALSAFRKSQNCPLIRIVLYRNDRKFLSSDISTEREAWEEALKAYRNEEYDVFPYADGDKSLPFLFLGSATKPHSRFSGLYLKKIADVRERVGIEFDIDYELTYVSEIALIIENPSFLERFTTYTRQLNKTVPREIYKENMLRELFDNKGEFEQILFPLFSLYKEKMKSICVWNIDGDKKQLAKKLRAAFKNHIKTEIPTFFDGRGKTDYMLYLKEHRDDVYFKTDCMSFFNDIQKNVMKKFILDKLSKLEELIYE